LNVLTEKEKQELREMAASAAIRDEFRLLRRNSRAVERIDIDAFIDFLNATDRLSPVPPRRRTFVHYPSVKL
jgi:hypothetical protein